MENAAQTLQNTRGDRERLKSYTSPLDQYLRIRPNVAIDLGTATTRVFTHRGFLIEKPSSVPVRIRSSFKGKESMMIYPLKNGVIWNVPATVALLQPMVRKSRRFGVNPIAIACVPTTASLWDRQRFHDALLQAGCSSVEMIQEPIAAAIGAGLNMDSQYAQMLIDIGEGVTDLAIIQQGRLVRTLGLEIACADTHTSIQRRIYEQHGIWLSVSEARRIALLHDSTASKQSVLVRGTGRSGSQIEIEIEIQDVIDAMQDPIGLLIDATVQFLRDLSDDVACQVIETGITVTGGGALLPGLIKKLEIETSLEVHVAVDPLHSVVHGAAKAFLT
jgi:rod shape-determining protein MreB and related proteins